MSRVPLRRNFCPLALQDVIWVRARSAAALKLDALIVQFPTLRFAFYDSAAFVLGTINSDALYHHSSLSSERRTPSPVSDMQPQASHANSKS